MQWRAQHVLLNPVSTTFAPSATSGQFWVKTQSISSPALLSLSGWTMQMHACSASLFYLEMLQISVQPCPSVETPPLASSLSPHSLQNCPTHFQVTPHHSSIISFIPIHPYVPSHALRSSSAQRLCVPNVSSVFGSVSFRSAGLVIWNSLPLSVISCSTIHTFNRQLKTHLFASAFPSSWIDLDAPLIRWSPLIYLSGILVVIWDFILPDLWCHRQQSPPGLLCSTSAPGCDTSPVPPYPRFRISRSHPPGRPTGWGMQLQTKIYEFKSTIHNTRSTWTIWRKIHWNLVITMISGSIGIQCYNRIVL